MADTNEIKEMADVIHHELFNFQRSRCEKLAEKLHEADFVKVVRCKDCRFFTASDITNSHYCDWHREYYEVYPYEYCYYGERKEVLPMTENEQIEELAEELIGIQRDFNEYCAKPCRECELGGIVNCENHYKAEALYSKGYRKVVQCKDCIYSKHWYRDRMLCSLWNDPPIDVWEDAFCSYGIRKEQNNDGE